MIRVIFLHLEGEYGFILDELLKKIDIHSMIWEIGFTEVFPTERFSADWMDVEAFGKLIKAEPDYLLRMGEFKAFPNKQDIVSINTYQDFIRSNCQIVILIDYSRYMDIYAKNLAVIEQIRENSKNVGTEEVHYITDDNDERTKMMVS